MVDTGGNTTITGSEYFTGDRTMNINTHNTEIYKVKEYKNKSAFINACANCISKLTGEYPEDTLTMVYDANDGRTLGEILETDEKFCYSDEYISIDFRMDGYIYGYTCN